jgi:hypothetical protein
MPCLLWSAKVHYRVHNSLPAVLSFDQMNHIDTAVQMVLVIELSYKLPISPWCKVTCNCFPLPFTSVCHFIHHYNTRWSSCICTNWRLQFIIKRSNILSPCIIVSVFLVVTSLHPSLYQHFLSLPLLSDRRIALQGRWLDHLSSVRKCSSTKYYTKERLMTARTHTHTTHQGSFYFVLMILSLIPQGIWELGGGGTTVNWVRNWKLG